MRPLRRSGEQAVRVQLRYCDLRVGPVYLIGDLRTFVALPYAAPSREAGHRTWPSGRRALPVTMRCYRPAVIAAPRGPAGRRARVRLRGPASSTASARPSGRHHSSCDDGRERTMSMLAGSVYAVTSVCKGVTDTSRRHGQNTLGMSLFACCRNDGSRWTTRRQERHDRASNKPLQKPGARAARPGC